MKINLLNRVWAFVIIACVAASPHAFSVAAHADAPITNAWWQPVPGLTWQYQLSGLPVNQTVDAQVFNIDAFENDAKVVAELHKKGKRVIAYMCAGSWEKWRPDAVKFPAQTLGQDLEDWPDEKWLDIRRIDLLGPIIEARLDMAKAKGFDAVEFDNVDGYNNKSGFPLTYADQIKFNTYLANEAHERGLAVGLKNDVEQIPDLVSLFDFAVNEECFEYEESETLIPFIKAGKAVFHVEYKLPLKKFAAKAKALQFSSIRKRLKLDAYREVAS